MNSLQVLRALVSFMKVEPAPDVAAVVQSIHGGKVLTLDVDADIPNRRFHVVTPLEGEFAEIPMIVDKWNGNQLSLFNSLRGGDSIAPGTRVKISAGPLASARIFAVEPDSYLLDVEEEDDAPKVSVTFGLVSSTLDVSSLGREAQGHRAAINQTRSYTMLAACEVQAMAVEDPAQSKRDRLAVYVLAEQVQLMLHVFRQHGGLAFTDMEPIEVEYGIVERDGAYYAHAAIISFDIAFSR